MGTSKTVQRAAEVIARRDVEHRQPPPQQRSGDPRQAALITEIDDVQGAAIPEAGCGALQNALPVGDHRKAVGNHHMVE